MKKKILLAGGGLAVLGGAAFFLVATAGVPKKPRIEERGQPQYYTSDLLTQNLPEIMTNLRSRDAKFVKIVATAEFRVGEELKPEEVPALFSSKEAKLRDGFTMLLSSKAPEDIASREQKELLKQEMSDLIQKIVFPEKKGRLEGILFRDFQIQG